jgi:Na+/H+ antiporter NhaC
MSLGVLSLAPVIIALILAFRTRNAVFRVLVGCVVGVVLAGMDPATGLAELFQDALGNRNFIWVMMIEVVVGIMVAFYLRAGVIAAFSEWASRRIRTRRAASGFGWLMGFFVFFSDYCSPIFSGPIARPLTDRHKVSREMLAYLLDSGSGPVCTLIPLSGWAVFIAGILVGYGSITTAEEGMPVLIIIGVAMGSFFATNQARVLEAFLAAIIFQAVAMSAGRYFEGVKDGMEVATNGIKAVLPAILILAMAYCINASSKDLGAQQVIISLTQNWMTPVLLPAVAFVTGAAISFFTGTSWGSYAVVTPFVMPMAMNLSGGAVSDTVLITVGAIVGGGLFGGQPSPVSDTTCLSSFGAGSDHMDHVVTKLPFALLAGVMAILAYLVLGRWFL